MLTWNLHVGATASISTAQHGLAPMYIRGINVRSVIWTERGLGSHGQICVAETVREYACTHRLRKSRASLKHWLVDTQFDDQ